MKKQISLVLFMLAVTSIGFAQAPDAIPYQGIARDASGNVLATQNISLRMSIHDVTAGGTVVYQETHTTTTTVLGLFTVNIGEGTPVSGTLAGVNWGSGAKFMQVELDAAGGSSYIDMGTTQLMSVPYALYAKTAESVSNDSWAKNGNDISAANTGNVGIGTNTPKNNLVVANSDGVIGLRIGHTGNFNEVESGTLIFDEDVAYVGSLGNESCGFTWRHNGANNTLTLTSGCGGQDTVLTVERSSRHIGINQKNPAVLFEVDGVAAKAGGGSWAVASDKNLKKNISPYEDGLAQILKIDPVWFSYNAQSRMEDQEKQYVGILAQDMQKIAPYTVEKVVNDELNEDDADGGKVNPDLREFLMFDPSSLDFMLINAVKEQQVMIETQSKLIQELLQRVEELEKE